MSLKPNNVKPSERRLTKQLMPPEPTRGMQASVGLVAAMFVTFLHEPNTPLATRFWSSVILASDPDPESITRKHNEAVTAKLLRRGQNYQHSIFSSSLWQWKLFRASSR